MIRLKSSLMRRKGATLAVASAAIALLLVAANATADVQYTIIDLGTLAGTQGQSFAYGINNSGQVVGQADTSSGYYHAFRTAANQPINPAADDLGTLGGRYSRANGINDGGQVVGWSRTSGDDANHAFRTGANQPINPATDDMGTLAIYNSWLEAFGINDNGQAAGVAISSTGNRAFRTGANQPINPATDDMGTLGGTTSTAYGINNSGQVVGVSTTATGRTRAFRTAANERINPATDDLGTLGGTYSYACAINDSGQVVGGAETNDGHVHAFRTAANQGINRPTDDLGTLGAPYNDLSVAYGINSSGQVVGLAETSDYDKRAFVYSGSGPMQDLNSLIAPSSGWTLKEARAINDMGQIVGYGTNSAGQTHAFLLTPLWEPLKHPRLDPGPLPPVSSGNNKLILYTHGWNTTQEAWLEEAPNDPTRGNWRKLDNALKESSSTEGWVVFGYDWTEQCGRLAAGQLPGYAMNNAFQLGKAVGDAIVASGTDEVHLIAHSAGSALIARAAEIIKRDSPATVVHTTFLDPYEPPYDIFDGRYIDWSEFYGKDSAWSDNYVVIDSTDYFPGVFTEQPDGFYTAATHPKLAYAHNVDITLLGDHQWKNGVAYSTHAYPIQFYIDTINDPHNPQYAHYGFERSMEGGGWDDRSSYPPGNDPVALPVGGASGFDSPAYAIRRDEPINLAALPSRQTSLTGTVVLNGTSLDLETGSPVWIAMDLATNLPVNFLTFEAEFTSGAGAEGLLAVYWENEVIGLLDERWIDPGEHGYCFDLPQRYEPGIYSLAFRLDPYTDVPSSATIDNIRTGLLSLVPEPTTFVFMIVGAGSLLAYAWSRRRAKAHADAA